MPKTLSWAGSAESEWGRVEIAVAAGGVTGTVTSALASPEHSCPWPMGSCQGPFPSTVWLAQVRGWCWSSLLSFPSSGGCSWPKGTLEYLRRGNQFRSFHIQLLLFLDLSTLKVLPWTTHVGQFKWMCMTCITSIFCQIANLERLTRAMAKGTRSI